MSNNQLIKTISKLVNDEALINKALKQVDQTKLKPYNISGKNNYIYTLLPHTKLHKGLDGINKSLKKPSNNTFIIVENKNESKIIKQLYKLYEEDVENNFIISVIMLQTEKERNINFKPTSLDIN